MNPGDLARFTQVFHAHASSTLGDGQTKAMTMSDFVAAIAPSSDFYNIPKAKYSILFQIADQTNAGRVSLDDFLVFQHLLSKPDAEFEVLFRLIDRTSSGVITVDQFKTFWDAHNPSVDHYGAATIKLYLGSDKDRRLSYPEFAQLLKGLQDERLVAEFKLRDSNETGLISQQDFHDLVLSVAGHRLSPVLTDRIAKVYPGATVSFAKVSAFMNVLRNLESIEKAVAQAAEESTSGRITKPALFKAFANSKLFDGFTPLEIDTIFKLVAEHHSNETPDIGVPIPLFQKLFDPQYGSDSASSQSAKDASQQNAIPAADTSKQLSPWMEVLKSAYNFALGSVAGAVGATFVYPIGTDFKSI